MSKEIPSYTFKGCVSEALLALRLFDLGAIKFGSFEVVNPKLSPSPIYIDIRTKDNPKPGPIGEIDLEMIAGELFRVVEEASMGFDFVCGVPNAGNPIADKFLKMYDPKCWIEKLALKKKASGSRFYPLKKISNGRLRRGRYRVLLLDNAISGGDTNLEAIRTVEKAGYIVSGVCVLVDREQGGSDKIISMGYKFVCWKKITDLLDFYFSTARINWNTLNEVKSYIEIHKI